MVGLRGKPPDCGFRSYSRLVEIHLDETVQEHRGQAGHRVCLTERSEAVGDWRSAVLVQSRQKADPVAEGNRPPGVPQQIACVGQSVTRADVVNGNGFIGNAGSRAQCPDPPMTPLVAFLHADRIDRNGFAILDGGEVRDMEIIPVP